ncbi:MAG: FAD:protein FMN transferase [Limnochordia bacterium]|jgi:thiamine biosynthesis lipoprotein
MARKGRLLSFFIVLLLIIGGWYGYTNRTVDVRDAFIAMDTFVEIRAIGRGAQGAIEAAKQELLRVEKLFDRFSPDTQIHKLNERAAQEPVPVSGETKYLLEQGIYYGELTDGAFDITIGRLADAWGFGTSPGIPSPETMAAVLPLVDYRLVELVDGYVSLAKEGVVLDVGGIAKGHAVDRGVNLLQEQGIQRALVNAGGDIFALGTRPDGNPWRVGIQNPEDPQRVIAAIGLVDQAIATSGDYQRFFEVDGTRYHHILDPRGGYPVRGLSSVSVIAPTALAADALATGVFVLGIDKGLALVESLKDVEALLITDEGKIILSSGLEGKVQFFGGE